MPSKRAFDRLDMSPFDFGSLSKRYFDEDELDLASRGKRAFDRITGGGFGLGLQKRAFDRIDGGFMLGKRSSGKGTNDAFESHVKKAFMKKNIERPATKHYKSLVAAQKHKMTFKKVNGVSVAVPLGVVVAMFRVHSALQLSVLQIFMK